MPLGTGIRVGHSDLSIVDVEVTGATATGIDVSDESRVSLLGCDLHDNRGVALAIRPGTAARIAHSTFAQKWRGKSCAADRAAERRRFRRQCLRGRQRRRLQRLE